MRSGALTRAKITQVPVTLTGPALPPSAPLGFCVICAAAWKARAFEDQSTDVTAADASPEPITIALHARGLPPPALAVTTALVVLPLPPGIPATGQPTVAPLPVCWTHAQAVSFTGSGLIAAPGPILLDGRPHTRTPHP